MDPTLHYYNSDFLYIWIIYHDFKKNYNELETPRSDVYGIKKKPTLSRIYEAVGIILFANVTLSNDLDNNENLTAKESANTQLLGLSYTYKQLGIKRSQPEINVELNGVKRPNQKT